MEPYCFVSTGVAAGWMFSQLRTNVVADDYSIFILGQNMLLVLKIVDFSPSLT